MTSDRGPREAYVWIWLPNATEPVVAGRLSRDGNQTVFNYGRSYLEREHAIAIYLPELPLKSGIIPPIPPLSMASCLRDAAPDAWGRRVVISRLTGLMGRAASAVELDELTFLLESGSDRVGALDFQASPSVYEPRAVENATLEELVESAERVEAGEPLTPQLALALQHGTAVGGARPKALIQTDTTKYVAKFSSTTDTYNVVKAEYIAMRLAAIAGLQAAPVELTRAMNRDVLLVERFDRQSVNREWTRRAMVSALTLFGLDELMAAHASYQELADLIRQRFVDARLTLRELFGRLCFNVLVGNTDDHARNHAAFWDGDRLELTPAYDICPQARTGHEASQGMLINDAVRESRLSACLDASNVFLLQREDALQIMISLILTLRNHWDAVCREAQLPDTDKALLWRRQFLNHYALDDIAPQLGAAAHDL